MDYRHHTGAGSSNAKQFALSKVGEKVILRENFAANKICSRWIPHNFSIDQKQARVDWCKKMTKQHNYGALKAVYNIYKGNEFRIYAYDPVTKQQSTVWVFQDEPNRTEITSDTKHRNHSQYGIVSLRRRVGARVWVHSFRTDLSTREIWACGAPRPAN
ncbi:hypothetical protein EVAR_26694_1 [Eumeta japonica]|uniref:Mariner Mos1 transposase n=1 Tax=Eumeta variegata TaxID=151549 RepID=A0A4C1VLY8_EUMVA|nr:hypothetical protein EVAR_26694_1 [Eumeta japonica]